MTLSDETGGGGFLLGVRFREVEGFGGLGFGLWFGTF